VGAESSLTKAFFIYKLACHWAVSGASLPLKSGLKRDGDEKPMTRRVCWLQVDFEQKIVTKKARLSIGHGNDKWGSIRMDCFGFFTFDRQKKLCANASTNGLLSEQNPKIMRGSRMLEVNHFCPIHPLALSDLRISLRILASGHIKLHVLPELYPLYIFCELTSSCVAY